MGDNKAKVILAIEDLLFISKITTVLQRLGITYAYAIDSLNELESKVSDSAPLLLLLDLAISKYDAVEAIRILKAEEATKSVSILAYTGHTSVEVLQKARDAGADKVLTKGEFSANLPKLVEEFVKE